ncbi:hypothetical protein OV079_38735 [Nannocystis pusilla]|uniref:Uncharacterized protein n=1 Tax=Nannocystis pusilla TaxID=889268 RepID=A0A9X3J2S5_9BACT|nr:hypothetical protein [Nannocystis pusilla]MCY1011398.1 hypothetical protein [Nannocystis pusilla]
MERNHRLLDIAIVLLRDESSRARHVTADRRLDAQATRGAPAPSTQVARDAAAARSPQRLGVAEDHAALPSFALHYPWDMSDKSCHEWLRRR